MLAFEVSVNDKVVCVAGLEDYGVLTAILSWVRRRPDGESKPDSEELDFSVAGLAGGEHSEWLKQELKMGDTIGVRIIEVATADIPGTHRQDDPEQDAKRERAYYEHLKRKYEGQ